jgi:hypothetical protein
MALCFHQKILRERKSAIAPTLDSNLKPGGNEPGFGNSTVKCEFPVKVGDSLPRNDRAEVRRLQRRDVPLRHGQIGRAHQANTPGTPGLQRYPFDEVVIVLCVQWPQHARLSFRFVHSSDVSLDDGIAVFNPVRRITPACTSFIPLAQIGDEHFDRPFDLNVKGLLFATQAAATAFGDEGGSVVNISSIVSLGAIPNSAVYSATKAAVDSFTRTLAAELGPRKIRVNSVLPVRSKRKAPTTWPRSTISSRGPCHRRRPASWDSRATSRRWFRSWYLRKPLGSPAR